jgi:hypothetical protein
MLFKSALRTIAVTAALLGAALISAPQSVIAATSQELSINVDGEKAVTAELKELRSLMGQLNNDADRLTSLGFSRLHWQTHADRLNKIKNHVNRIGDRLETLQGMRYTAAPWQQEAINSVVPVAVDVAERTTAAISHLNENRTYLWAPEYVDHLRTISALSDNMQGLLDNHLKIIEARDKLDLLEEKLAERVS